MGSFSVHLYYRGGGDVHYSVAAHNPIDACEKVLAYEKQSNRASWIERIEIHALTITLDGG